MKMISQNKNHNFQIKMIKMIKMIKPIRTNIMIKMNRDLNSFLMN